MNLGPISPAGVGVDLIGEITTIEPVNGLFDGLDTWCLGLGQQGSTISHDLGPAIPGPECTCSVVPISVTRRPAAMAALIGTRLSVVFARSAFAGHGSDQTQIGIWPAKPPYW